MSVGAPASSAAPVQHAKGALRMFDMILFSVCAMLLLSQVTLTAQIGPSALVWTALVIVLFFVPYGLMTAELGSTYPDTGGIYSWVVRAFGNRWGTRTSWWYWVNVALWVPSVYLMFSAVLSAMFFPDLGFWPQVGIALALILVNWAVNMVALDAGKWVSNLGAVITVLVIAVVAVGGVMFASSNGSATDFAWTTDSMIPTWSTMAIALPIIIYNFLGFELMSSASNEMRNPRRDVPRTIIIAGALIGFFYLIATFGIQLVIPAEDLSDTSGLMDALHGAVGDSGVAGAVVTVLGIGILYAFFAGLIPWTIGANRAAAEAATMGDLPKVFAHVNPRRDTPTGAATLTALVSGAITLIYGVLFSMTDGSIDELFWSLFAFSSIIFLLPYVVMSLAFLRLRTVDAAAVRPYKVPGGRAGAVVASVLVVISLVAALVFFVWNPFDEFDPTTFGLIVGGLVVTFVVQEVFVALAPRWRVARASEAEAAELAAEGPRHVIHVHPEAVAEVELEGHAPDDCSTLDVDDIVHGHTTHRTTPPSSKATEVHE